MRYDSQFRISVFFPTRNRVEPLKKSLTSLINTASTMDGIEILLAVDDDDQPTIDYINGELVAEFNEKNIAMRAFTFPRQGYANLHHYYNHLVKESLGNWLFLWNDDAIMKADNWDLAIERYNGQMKVLRFSDNHDDHPNAIFPCVPRDWLLLFGEFSPNQHADSWVSQIGYLTDCMQNVPEVEILHDRHDLTGNNDDQTAQERSLLESNPSNPRDINHPDFLNLKVEWSSRLNWYLHKTNQNTGWFDSFMSDKTFDVWKKYRETDINNQCFILPPPE